VNLPEMMQLIHDTGIPDSKTAIILGYSAASVLHVRKRFKNKAGKERAVPVEMVAKIKELYEQRKGMPKVKVINGWQKRNQVKRYIDGVWR